MARHWWRGRSQGAVAAPELVLSDAAWRARLTPAQYDVLRRSATEPPWSGKHLQVDERGTFTCAGCGAALFTTDARFESGTGWPSFDRPAGPDAVAETTDRAMFMTRTEITCAHCGGHLGHVFADGPTETGRRYCVNSLSLDFEADEP